MTIAPLKSFGKFDAECSIGLELQSTQILPTWSVVIFPNFGILTASIPDSVTLTWKLGSSDATLRVSRLMLGYNKPADCITIGTLLVTPSISGKVLTTPIPAALSLNGLMFGCILSYLIPTSPVPITDTPGLNAG